MYESEKEYMTRPPQGCVTGGLASRAENTKRPYDETDAACDVDPFDRSPKGVLLREAQNARSRVHQATDAAQKMMAEAQDQMARARQYEEAASRL